MADREDFESLRLLNEQLNRLVVDISSLKSKVEIQIASGNSLVPLLTDADMGTHLGNALEGLAKPKRLLDTEVGKSFMLGALIGFVTLPDLQIKATK